MTTDLALIASDPSALEAASDPAQFVVQACERAKTWLAEALEHGDIEQIVELKSQADAIRIYTMSKQLGKDAQLSAAEVVRRAERGIAVAIRRGQDAGKITAPSDTRAGHRNAIPSKVSPRQYLTHDQERSDAYAMTDGVSNERFEAAVAEAKAEGNLSRANVVRKVRDAAEPAPAPEPTKPAPAKKGRKRRPITDAARDTGWALRKEVEKVERILADDRFASNKDQVAAHLHGHLTYAVETLQRALGHFTQEGQ